jgi:hypothetical protein
MTENYNFDESPKSHEWENVTKCYIPSVLVPSVEYPGNDKIVGMENKSMVARS